MSTSESLWDGKGDSYGWRILRDPGGKVFFMFAGNRAPRGSRVRTWYGYTSFDGIRVPKDVREAYARYVVRSNPSYKATFTTPADPREVKRALKGAGYTDLRVRSSEPGKKRKAGPYALFVKSKMPSLMASGMSAGEAMKAVGKLWRERGATRSNPARGKLRWVSTYPRVGEKRRGYEASMPGGKVRISPFPGGGWRVAFNFIDGSSAFVGNYSKIGKAKEAAEIAHTNEPHSNPRRRRNRS